MFKKQKGKILMEISRTESVVQLFLKVVNRYIATEKKPCDYDVGCSLYRSEIHTIDAIKKHDHINITELANYLGITKSAVSQMINKLVKKGMVVKTVLSKSDTEVALTLTEIGEKVCQGHDQYHRELYQYLDQVLTEIPESDIEVFKNILNQLDNILN